MNRHRSLPSQTCSKSAIVSILENIIPVLIVFVVMQSFLNICHAQNAEKLSPSKPEIEKLLKPRSIERVLEGYEIIANSEWNDDDFSFVNAALIRAPLRQARPQILNFKKYPEMQSAIKKFEYNPKTNVIEVIGEASGLRMHSWVKVDFTYWDEITYTIVSGDMIGFKVNAYLWEKNGKTLAIGKGIFPNGKKMLPSFVATLFKPVSEVVISVATNNFRSYIEEEYKKQIIKPRETKSFSAVQKDGKNDIKEVGNRNQKKLRSID